MNKINKLSIPLTILLASIILGGFYYATEVNKQKSIERQQENKLAEDRRVEAEKNAKLEEDASKKRLCVNESIESAQDYYRSTCTYDCKEGQYFIATYEHDYKTCLQREGIE